MSQVRMSNARYRLEEASLFLRAPQQINDDEESETAENVALLLQVCTMFKSAEDLVYNI